MAEAKARDVFGLCLAFLSLTLIAAPRRHRAADRREAEPTQYPSHHAPRTISHNNPHPPPQKNASTPESTPKPLNKQAAAKNPERAAQRKLSMGAGTVEGRIESVLKAVRACVGRCMCTYARRLRGAQMCGTKPPHPRVQPPLTPPPPKKYPTIGLHLPLLQALTRGAHEVGGGPRGGGGGHGESGGGGGGVRGGERGGL